MSLSIQEVEHIARLARLELTDAQKARYRVQLEAILDHVAKLQRLDTKDIPPTTSVTAIDMPLRMDEPAESLRAEDLLKNAPDQENGQFRTPSVFD